MKALFLLAASALALSAHAAQRVALVIGNSAYQHASTLPNALPDAKLVASRLADLDYEVTDISTCQNLSKKDFNRRLAAFGTSALQAEVAVFYYAGHGVMGTGDKQYLLPVDAALEQEADFSTEGVCIDDVLRTLSTSQVKAKVLILDCCRNNPFEGSGVSRSWLTRDSGGLGEVKGDLPAGTAIMFSAAPGAKAKDGPLGGNSPFASALVATLGLPGADGKSPQPILNAMMAISSAVETSTTRVIDGQTVKQEPYLKFDGKPQLLASLSFAGRVSLEPRREDPEVKRLREENARLLAMQGKSGAGGSSDVIPGPAPTTATPASATKANPFINSLGMKFVPTVEYKSEGRKVQFCIWETRSRDYAAFVKEAGSTRPAAAASDADDWRSYQYKGVPVGRGASERAEDSLHPAANVSWDDAKAFCAWLTKKEQASGVIGSKDSYRLPTDVEWSYAVGIGAKEDAQASPEAKDAKIPGVYPWGGDSPPTGKAGNYADSTAKAKGTALIGAIEGYTDGYATTAPVGSFAPDETYGLYDLGGNLWEWCEDTYSPKSTARVLRGASWDYYDASNVLSSNRDYFAASGRSNGIGFRCVLVAGGR
jgi:formylglycine-generating enzyme required for sulfatase activity